MRNTFWKFISHTFPPILVPKSSCSHPILGHIKVFLIVKCSRLPLYPMRYVELLRKRLGDAIFSILIFPFSFAS